eukprot:8320282-Alexandrium_andersonii.AAC.1
MDLLDGVEGDDDGAEGLAGACSSISTDAGFDEGADGDTDPEDAMGVTEEYISTLTLVSKKCCKLCKHGEQRGSACYSEIMNRPRQQSFVARSEGFRIWVPVVAGRRRR